MKDGSKEPLYACIIFSKLFFEEASLYSTFGMASKGEQPEQTVIREMKEELGFETEVKSLVQTHVLTIKGSLDESIGVFVVSYLCKLVKKTGTFEREGEAGKALFQKFPIREIPLLPMPDFYKVAIQRSWETKRSL